MIVQIYSQISLFWHCLRHFLQCSSDVFRFLLFDYISEYLMMTLASSSFDKFLLLVLIFSQRRNDLWSSIFADPPNFCTTSMNLTKILLCLQQYLWLLRLLNLRQSSMFWIFFKVQVGDASYFFGSFHASFLTILIFSHSCSSSMCSRTVIITSALN